LGVNHGLDQEALKRTLGVEVVEVFRNEGLQFGGIFAGDDDRSSVDAIFR